MKRPFVPILILYVTGLVIADWVPVSLPPLYALSFLIAISCLLSRDWRPWLVPPLIVLVGWTHLASHTAILSPHDLRLIAGDEPRLTVVRGRLLETPLIKRSTFNKEPALRSRAVVSITEMLDHSQWIPAHGLLLASTPDVLPEFFTIGTDIEVDGILRRPPVAPAPGLFDYRAFLSRKGIHYQFLAASTDAWKPRSPVDPGPPPLQDRFRRWAMRTMVHGLPETDEAAELRWAMALGWKLALTDEVSEPFMRSGTMHLFAISGLHIALVTAILLRLLRVLQVPRAACGLLMLPLLWFYVAVTGWQPSATRAAIMSTVVVVGWSLNRPGDLVNSLAAAAFIILIHDPLQLFQAGFQLSFAVVFSIALWLPVFDRVRLALLSPDPLLPPDLRPRWQQRLDGPTRYLSTSFATSLAACLGSAPLIAHYFHLVTPVSLLANLVVVPLGAFALMSSLGSLICGAWWPLGTELCNHAGWLSLRLMMDISAWCALLPGAWFSVPAPTFLQCLAAYSLLLLPFLLPRLKPPARRRLGALFLTTLLLAAWPLWHSRHNWTLTLLPLDGGEAVWIDAPGKRNDLLIDCGNARAAERITIPFLRSQGVNHIPRLALTHGDIRNYGGATNVIEDFRIREVLLSRARFRSTGYRRLEQHLTQTNLTLTRLNPGDHSGIWKILHPPAESSFSRADDAALVLKGEIHGVRILLLSDLGRAGQESLLASGVDLKAHVVVAGLPEQDEPLRSNLLDAIQPELIVITDSEYPATQRAPQRLRERFERTGTPIVYLRDIGAIKLHIRPDGWTFEPPPKSHLPN